CRHRSPHSRCARLEIGHRAWGRSSDDFSHLARAMSKSPPATPWENGSRGENYSGGERPGSLTGGESVCIQCVGCWVHARCVEMLSAMAKSSREGIRLVRDDG